LHICGGIGEVKITNFLSILALNLSITSRINQEYMAGISVGKIKV